MQRRFQWKISLFSNPPVSTPQTYQDHCRFLFFMKSSAAFYWPALASEIHNTLLVSGSPTPIRGIPLLSLLVLEMNEFVQSAQVWIQTLILPWQATAAACMQKHYKPFIPANAEAGRWHPPGYLGAQGAAASSSLLPPLNIDGAVRIFIIYWFYAKGYTMYHQILSALQTEKQANTTNRESCKTYRSQESLSLPLLQLWVQPKASKHQFCLKTKKSRSQSLPLWSVLLFSHEGAPISRNASASTHTGSQYWSNSTENKFRSAERPETTARTNSGQMPQPDLILWLRTQLWILFCYTSVHSQVCYLNYQLLGGKEKSCKQYWDPRTFGSYLHELQVYFKSSVLTEVRKSSVPK